MHTKRLTALQSFKAHAIVGAECRHYADVDPRVASAGSATFYTSPHSVAFHGTPNAPTHRRVLAVKSREVGLSIPTRDDDRPSWLPFPKASEVAEPVPGRFRITIDPGIVFVYDFRTLPDTSAGA